MVVHGCPYTYDPKTEHFNIKNKVSSIGTTLASHKISKHNFIFAVGETETCRFAFCYSCMVDYVLNNSSVSQTVDENYKVWLKKNKHRKLKYLQPLKYEPLQAPEFFGTKTYELWLTDKNKKIKELKEKGGGAAAASEAADNKP